MDDRRTPTTLMLAAMVSAMTLSANNAHALTQGQCADAVVRACNKAFPNNYNGRIACVNNGLDTCDTLAQSRNRDDAARSRLKFKANR